MSKRCGRLFTRLKEIGHKLEGLPNACRHLGLEHAWNHPTGVHLADHLHAIAAGLTREDLRVLDVHFRDDCLAVLVSVLLEELLIVLAGAEDDERAIIAFLIVPGLDKGPVGDHHRRSDQYVGHDVAIVVVESCVGVLGVEHEELGGVVAPRLCMFLLQVVACPLDHGEWGSIDPVLSDDVAVL